MTSSHYWSFVLKTPNSPSQDQFYEQAEGAAMSSPVSPIVVNVYMEYLEQKALSTAPHTLGSGAGLWQIPLSFTRRSINKTSYNTSIVLTLPSGLQWRTTRRMGPSPSWTLLLNQRLMVVYPLLYIENPLIPTDTYSGIATITSQLNLVPSIPSSIGPKQSAVVLSCSNKKWTTLGRLSLNANILNGLWTKWRKDSTGLPVRLLMGLIIWVPQVPRLPPNKVITKGHIVIPFTQGPCESIKKICGKYGIQTHFKGGSTIRNLLVSPRTKTLWSTKVVPYTGTNVGT